MTNHDYFSFQEKRYQLITLSLLVKKMEFVIWFECQEMVLFYNSGLYKTYKTRNKVIQA